MEGKISFCFEAFGRDKTNRSMARPTAAAGTGLGQSYQRAFGSYTAACMNAERDATHYYVFYFIAE
jgi:hypothetical protein